jgi:Zn-dependent peptidase ImmA (M78 family)/DNA-binding XRE family transcriptional regulator
MRIGVGGFQPLRLTQAREALGITKVALATLVNVSSATVTQWESGKQNPQEDKLRSIAAALGQDIYWFLKPVVDSSSKPYFFRSLSAAAKTGRVVTKTKIDWLTEISSSLEVYLDWPELNIPSINKPFTAISDEEIEELAIEYREKSGLGIGPIKDLMLSVESSGVICTRTEIGFDKLDGLSNWSSTDHRAYILLASDKNNGIRSRFDLAHELGHIVIHRYVSKEQFTLKNLKEIERQANLFASSLLLPAESFAKDLRSPTLETFLTLKPRWKTSISAMIYRAHQLDIITDLQYSNLYKNLSARGWRLREPYDDQVHPETPRLLHRAIDMLVNSGMGVSELLDNIGFTPAILSDLVGLPTGYFFDDKNIDNLLAFRSSQTTQKTVSDKPVSNKNVYVLKR